MKPQATSNTPVKNLGYKYSVIQVVLVFVTIFTMLLAGPETSSSGFFFGLVSVLLRLVTFAVGIVSLGVFLIWMIKHHTYQKGDGLFVLSIVFQVINVAFLAYMLCFEL